MISVIDPFQLTLKWAYAFVICEGELESRAMNYVFQFFYYTEIFVRGQ